MTQTPHFLELIRHDDLRLSLPLPLVQFPLSDLVKKDLSDLVLTFVGLSHRAIGLAANQCGLNHRAFVWVSDDHSRGQLSINPSFSPDEEAGIEARDEGCLSLPGACVKVNRFRQIQAFWTDLDGNPREATLSGLSARVFQHELDHLNGLTLLDKVAAADREVLVQALEKRLTKAAKRGKHILA